ncbi:MAG TPA: DUF6502 family protein [Wenzhouxiangella sp.]|nr:DUF6502 family protein [Wenzhouxiangella sp.]
MNQQSALNAQREDINWLIEAIVKMIRPIVRFAVGRVSCTALVNLIREVYVTEAKEYLKTHNPDRKITRSALALLCGMDSRAIASFEENVNKTYSVSDVSSPGTILEMWNKDKDFRDPETSNPAELLIHGPHGTFQRLVSRAAGRAVTPQTALDTLLESGNVQLNETGTHVRLVNPIYKPVKDSEKTAIQAGSLAVNLLGKAIVHNTNRHSGNQPPWLQQDRWSYRIPCGRLDRIRTEMREVIERHIQEIESRLEDEEQETNKGAECSVGIGWYYWEERASLST